MHGGQEPACESEWVASSGDAALTLTGRALPVQPTSPPKRDVRRAAAKPESQREAILAVLVVPYQRTRPSKAQLAALGSSLWCSPRGVGEPVFGRY
jgi:hypothetical protein